MSIDAPVDGTANLSLRTLSAFDLAGLRLPEAGGWRRDDGRDDLDEGWPADPEDEIGRVWPLG